MVVAKVRERLSVSKQAHKFHVQRFSLKKLSELEGRKQYEIKTLNRFAALENSSDSEDIHER
jgi:hypothetical protein